MGAAIPLNWKLVIDMALLFGPGLLTIVLFLPLTVKHECNKARAMSDDQLHFESFCRAEDGNHNSAASREIARRAGAN